MDLAERHMSTKDTLKALNDWERLENDSRDKKSKELEQPTGDLSNLVLGL